MASIIDCADSFLWDEAMSSQISPTSPTVPKIVVQATDLCKTFGTRGSTVTALDRVSVSFTAGQFAAIMGPSGSGKSTLLHCLAGLERPDSGSVVTAGAELTRMSADQLTMLRRDRLGFVFQSFNLIPTLTAAENITLSERIGGPRIDREWVDHLVSVLGLDQRLEYYPAEMSGGQQQRVAIARALAHRPIIVFADEPTGNLDSHTGGEVLDFLRLAVEHMGQTVIMVTHDPLAATHTHRVVFLYDGQVVDEAQNPTAQDILAHITARRMAV